MTQALKTTTPHHHHQESFMATASPFVYDDTDLDDATLWAVIDSAAASYSSSSATTTNSKFRKPLSLKNPNSRSPPQNYHSPRPRLDYHRPHKMARPSSFSETSETSPDLKVIKHAPVTPMMYSSPDSGKFSVKEISPYVEHHSPQFEYRGVEDKEKVTHCLAGRFPTVSLFKDYQDAAVKILERSDYTMISGNPFIKKSGWRKIAFYFNISFEIKDKSIEFDENRNVQRAEFVVRAYMQGGRFSDGWGSCERREKKFLKPNNDVPSTAETRAKNKACQDLLGIGTYRPSVSHNHTTC